jgi:hypothetical protein
LTDYERRLAVRVEVMGIDKTGITGDFEAAAEIVSCHQDIAGELHNCRSISVVVPEPIFLSNLGDH